MELTEETPTTAPGIRSSRQRAVRYSVTATKLCRFTANVRAADAGSPPTALKPRCPAAYSSEFTPSAVFQARSPSDAASSGSERSQRRVHARRPASSISAATSSSAPVRRAASTTSAPRPARCSAAARPIPLLAPATRTVWPSRSGPPTGSGAGCCAGALRGAGTAAGGPAGSDGIWPRPAPPSTGRVSPTRYEHPSETRKPTVAATSATVVARRCTR